MRFVFLCLMLICGSAFAQDDHQWVELKPTDVLTTAACAADGSTTLEVKKGTYLVYVFTAQVDGLCYAATCAANGIKIPVNTFPIRVKMGRTTTISCRSAGANAILQWARIN